MASGANVSRILCQGNLQLKVSISADFTTAVRTGGKGMNGVSLLLIERKFEGVSTRRMQCMGVQSSGTSYVTFE